MFLPKLPLTTPLALLALPFFAVNSYAGLGEDLPASEFDALVALYEATGGDSWAENTGWLDPSADTWFGISTIPTATGQTVSEIRLRRNELRGTIPPEIGNFPALTGLFLTGSIFLSGTIPPEIGNLSLLNDLDLQGNDLSGEIPSELGKLSFLTDLDLINNKLSGAIPLEIFSLSRLERLGLANNALTGVIPPEVGNLTALLFLSLDQNSFSGTIPPEIGNMTSLRILSLERNSLTGTIPPEIGRIASLTDLVLNNNFLSGSIPLEIFGLSNMDQLDLGFNGFSGSIPSEIGGLTALDMLDLQFNLFTGSIPAEIGQLSGIRFLDLSRNQLSGSIPSEIANNVDLQDLRLAYNNLTGVLPIEFADLSSLELFDIGVNSIEGEIPGAFATSPALKTFAIEENLFDLSPASANANLVLSLEERGVFVRSEPGSTYATWIALHFTEEELMNPSISGQLEDPDRDGVANLVEYAILTDPSIPSRPALPNPTVFVEDSVLLGSTLAFQIDFSRRDIRYVPEGSRDLLTWTKSDFFSAAEFEDTDEFNLNPVQDALILRLGPENRFFRLRIEFFDRDEPNRPL